MVRRAMVVGLVITAVFCCRPCSLAAAAEGGPAGDRQRVVVLDTGSVWRIHHALKPPVIQFDDSLQPVLVAQRWLNWETAPPPPNWREPDFDDSSWLRGPAGAAARTSYLERLCLRGRFAVADPAGVGEFSLTLGYYGGVIVHLNGHEVVRGHLAEGAPGLAEGYPAKAFVTDAGEIVPSGWQAARHPDSVALRERRLTDVPLPNRLLRPGVNVIAIEIVRAPYHRIVDEKKPGLIDRERGNRGTPYDLSWDTCAIRDVQLTALGDEGLATNASRPRGLQVWNGDLLTSDYTTGFGDQCEPLRPVLLKGARNGRFSGKVVVGYSGAIQGLKVTASDLRQGTSSIPASQVRVRYALPWGRSAANSGAYPRNAALLDALIESPLPEFPAGPDGGATVPLWVTVMVPRDAVPGTYTGQLWIEVEGEAPIKAPIRLEVADWALPDTRDYRTWVELVQSPTTLAAEYGVPLWSDRHWELIGASMRHMGEVGSRVVYVPLICHTNFGNEESMVRWVKKGEGGYDHDFSVMERYLDLAEKHMGRPKFVVFTAWEIYLDTPKEEVVIKEEDSSYVKMEKSWGVARWSLRGKGPAVTVVDASGKAETMYLPRYEDPAGKALWQPLWAELHRRMAKRGLTETMLLGMLSDRWPNAEETKALHELSGGLRWICHTHGGSRVGRKVHDLGEIAYIAYVWNCEYPQDPAEGRTYGWKRAELYAQYWRFEALNTWPAASLLHLAEFNIAGMQRGVGRIGADFWPVIRDKRGRRKGRIWADQLQSRWHSLDLHSHLLAPGPDGPVATARYEVFREGVQQCEARIAIEAVLTDEKLREKLGADLAKRCQETLDERLRYMWKGASSLKLTGRAGYDYASRPQGRSAIGGVAGHYWYVSSGWQERDQGLYALAAEVAAKVLDE